LEKTTPHGKGEDNKGENVEEKERKGEDEEIKVTGAKLGNFC
jgi:hypothetical protein